MCRSRCSAIIAHLYEMATTTVSNFPTAMSRPNIPSAQRFANVSPANLGGRFKVDSCHKLASVCHVASSQPFLKMTAAAVKYKKIRTNAMSVSNSDSEVPGLPIDLKGFTSISMNALYQHMYAGYVQNIVCFYLIYSVILNLFVYFTISRIYSLPLIFLTVVIWSNVKRFVLRLHSLFSLFKSLLIPKSTSLKVAILEKIE